MLPQYKGYSLRWDIIPNNIMSICSAPLLDMLWRAPELLRHKNPPARGTQEGDVYSFAIIMFEIQGRKGPYGNIDLSPKGKYHIPLIIKCNC